MLHNDAIHTAQRLGFLGLVPFLAFTLGGLLDLEAAASIRLFVIYSAIILSFLGGVHWGLAMLRDDAPTRELHWSMLPSIVGIAVFVAAHWLSSLVLLCILAVAHLFWLKFEKRHLQSPDHAWYIELRGRLTFTVVALHIILVIISI
ncbi:DUF3429 domain-containing protein [Pseudidiomarina sediminum]|uniref:DUF3429 domain-containing protein n=1 Tax=Pseudidiomarina sediminum TaxID=431675 RepID=A0A432ZAH3_9GAMM|nr:DUF3429 domain-containing protein [Pseudidiomarina sediminum]MBY6063555.1 DUF3429 domain-containing protein [Pseudidiomarina sediminum]RUO74382.1 DUF3429 domain-containing protein [Pseudidiomarina sediminum]